MTKRVYSPPAAMIDWDLLNEDVRSRWVDNSVELSREFSFGQSTTMSIWHGKPVGLLPFLRVCRRLKLDPLDYLVER